MVEKPLLAAKSCATLTGFELGANGPLRLPERDSCLAAASVEVRGVLSLSLHEVVAAGVDRQSSEAAHEKECDCRNRQELAGLSPRAVEPQRPDQARHSTVITLTVFTVIPLVSCAMNGVTATKWYCTSTATCFTDWLTARGWAELQLASGGLAVATAGQMYA